METLEAIRRRRAVRDYKPDPVSKEALEQIVVAASWAPSAMNAQPWRFTIVTDRQLLSDISERAKRFMIESVDALPQPDHFRDLMQNPDFDLFYNAPVLLVISAPREQRWGIEDCALAAENAMLAATHLGLASCWIGFAQDWLNCPDGLETLGLPSRQCVVAPLILGYARVMSPPAARKTPEMNWIEQGADSDKGKSMAALESSRTSTRLPPGGLEAWNCWEPFCVYPKNLESLQREPPLIDIPAFNSERGGKSANRMDG